MRRPLHAGVQLSAILLASVFLVACGGKKSSPAPPQPAPTNQLPVANAGPDQTVNSAAQVQLTAAASTDPDGSVVAYTWQQIGGPTVILSSNGAQAPTFQAPLVPANTILTFVLTVTDNLGGVSPADSVSITVLAGPNQLPMANAGLDQIVLSAATVTLTGAGSSDPDGGTIVGYAWTQTAGTAVTLSSASSATPTFIAPTVASDTTLTFSLSVTDNRAGVSAVADTVDILVVPPTNVTVSGKITFARIPMVAGMARLDYANTRQDPARGITLQAINTTTSAVIASGVTDAAGDYSVIVPGGINVRIRAVATMIRAAPLALPHWNFRVRPSIADADHVYDDAQFTTGLSAVVRNVQIPSGFNVAGQVTGTRSAAPFAILDTVYTAVYAVLAPSPTADFPLLTIDWATDNAGGETYYLDDGGGDNRVIVLAGQLNVDTDEYDQHVLAHEFGHYLEDRFSRSDSVGGAHTTGDRLHPSVAFGEGFGTAFGAMVLNDPVYRDTTGAGQAQGLVLNIENNTQLNPGWYSEASTYSILWDLFDATNDGVDTIALGFAPIWLVMTGEERTTDALTSMFSFATYLKQQNAAQVAGINAIVTGQNIVSSTIDIFGTTETNVPTGPSPPAASDVLPVFTPITIGGTAKTVTSIATYGLGNKLSVMRFLRLDVPVQQNVHVVVTTGVAGRDVDALIFRRGSLVAYGIADGNENFVVNNLAAGSYVIVVYDYDSFQEYSGSTTPITVTVTSN